MNLPSLIKESREARADVIEISHLTEAMHLGGCLSCIEILIALYFKVLSIRPEDPFWPDRDRFILSKGHAALSLYVVLAHRGFFSRDAVFSFNSNDSAFTEHPVYKNLPGIEATTGSLGHGLGIGIGHALAAKISRKSYQTVVLVSDGECNEGTIWEAALFAPIHQLSNLILIIDYNKWQACDRCHDIMALNPLAQKFSAFGWNIFEGDGHDLHFLINAFNHSQRENNAPTAIIAHTVKGKGVSFMEDDNNWHYRVPTHDEVILAKTELGVI